MCRMQHKKGQVLLPGSEGVGGDYSLVRRRGCDAEAEEGQGVGVSTEGRKGLGRGEEVSRWISQSSRCDSAANALLRKLLIF
jgi:hypothetical protein